MAEHNGCTCGSGQHPRKCEKHPWAYGGHVADLNHEALRDEFDEVREKVEALELNYQRLIALSTDTSSRLDAALNRIAELESQQERWRGTQRYVAPIDVEDV